MTVQQGSLLCGRYRLEKLIGNGGMADVYRAFDEDRQASVAVKVLHHHLAVDPDLDGRFRGEAEALAMLDHPSIVRLYAFEEADGEHFIVLDYVAGATLRDRLAASRRPFTLQEASSILRDICGALYYAHRNGIVHQDLKPGNIILRPDGRAVLTDFGIACALGSAGAIPVTMGTPAYMSPEQIRGDPADAQTDVYSLGVVLYEMVAGRRPFTGDEAGLTEADTTGRFHEAHLRLNAPDPCAFNPRVPAGAGAVILRALAKRPSDRWPDMLSFRMAWEAALGAQLSAHDDSADGKRVISPRPERRRKAAWAGVMVLGIVVALAALGFVAMTLLGENVLSAAVPALTPVPTTAGAPIVTMTVAVADATATPRPGAPGGVQVATWASAQPVVRPTEAFTQAFMTTRTEPTLAASRTVMPTAVIATPTPRRVADRATAPGQPDLAPVGVDLLRPSEDEKIVSAAAFAWQNSAGFRLNLGEKYELIVWGLDEDPMRDGRSPVGGTTRTNVLAHLGDVEDELRLSNGQAFYWGIRLWQDGVGPVRMLSEGRRFTYERAGDAIFTSPIASPE